MTLIRVILCIVIFTAGFLAGRAMREENWFQFFAASTIVVAASMLYWIA